MGLDIRTIRKVIDNFTPVIPESAPGQIHLVCDATFFRKRKDKDGLLIFYGIDKVTGVGKVLWHKFIQSETKLEYEEGLSFLLDKGFEILSATIDGRSGISQVFVSRQIPVQLCQFHVQTRVLTKTTQNPQTKPGKILKKLANRFIQYRWSQRYFTKCLDNFIKKYQIFLSERNDRGDFKHQSLRSALRSFKLALPYLFTYQTHTDLNIPNTTNHVDGGVNPKLKNLVYRHRGMRIDRRNKLLIKLLYNLKGIK